MADPAPAPGPARPRAPRAPRRAAARAAPSRAASLLAASLTLFAAALPLSIAVAEGALALAGLAWLAAGRPGRRSPLIAPAAAFAALTVLAALAAPRPLASLADAREVLLLAVLLVVPAAPAGGARRLAGWFVATSGASAAWGVSDYLASPGGLEHRATGPLSHWLTFGGLLMFALLAAVALLATRAGRATRLVPAVVLIAAGLATSYARSAWLGAGVGVGVVLIALRPRAFPAAVALVLLAAVLAPAGIRDRALSIASLEANQDRLEIWTVGLRLAARHPVLGLGPGEVGAAYAREPVSLPRQHLHNNALQLAAERGLFALAAWIWLVVAGARSALRRLAQDRRDGLAAAALGAVLALLTAGVFEYNFGDSEVKMAFLLLLALGTGPGAGERTAAPGTAA